MFRRFLKVIRLDHPRLVLLSMKTIMITVIDESDEIPMDLLETLLKLCQKGKPAASTLVEKVLSSCARKLQPCIIEALKSTGTSLDIYSPLVSSICQSESAITQGHSDVNYSPLVPGLEEEAEVVGGGTSKITCVYRRVKKKNAPWETNDEEPVILETGNPGRVDNRKPLVQLLDFRSSSEQWGPVLRHLYEEEAEEEDVDYLRQRDDSQVGNP
ncbi:PREDICTED: uncharacterized protein LOC104743333 [Camelina sativa]|uniref:Uncharacterized protein LOC104743333 n=1 Tax=Camelina sativa TaxID=90675 RepID=A0ABM1QW67_CAMSA|nr:PREDICTED: uncharacterized protein LOC104743333 [Camelina sativa]